MVEPQSELELAKSRTDTPHPSSAVRTPIERIIQLTKLALDVPSVLIAEFAGGEFEQSLGSAWTVIAATGLSGDPLSGAPAISEIPNDTILVPDMECGRRSVPFIPAFEGARFYAGTPLIKADRICGYLCAAAQEPRVVSSNEVSFLQEVGRLSEEILPKFGRQAAESRLPKQNAPYREMFENAVDGIFRTDRGGRYIEANPALARLYGYESAEEMIGAIKDIATDLYVNPNSRPEFIRMLDQFGAISHFEAEVYRKDRSTMWIRESARAVTDERGALLWFEGTVADITSRKKAEIETRRVNAELKKARAELESAVEARTAESAQTTHALRETERRLQSILDNTTAVIYVKDSEGRYILVNRQWERIFDRSAECSCGLTDYDLFPLEQAEAFRANDKAVIEQGGPIEVEEIATHGDERHTYISIKYPVRNAEGEIEYVCGISTDITDRKKAEKYLQESEARKAAILNAALDAIITIDSCGTIREINSAAERIFGYTAAEMIGAEMASLILPAEMRSSHKRGLAHYAKTGEGPVLGKRLEMEALRADGSRFPIELEVTRIPLEGPPMFTGHIRDISARVNAQRAVQESEARYARMAANAPGMVYQYLLRKNGTRAFLFVSEGCRDIYGYEPEEMLASAALADNAIHEDEREAFQASVLQSASALTPWLWEGRMRHKSGDIRWIRAASRPKVEENGDTIWDGIVIDITDRKRIEEELRRSKDEADSANRAKTEFLSRMSHELRTPLNAILGFGQLLNRTPLTSRQTECTSQILAAGRHLLDLINEILDLSRIESGKASISNEPVEIGELTREVIGLISPLAESHSVNLQNQIVEEHWTLSDRQRLRQILLNLLSNAVKYNKPGGTASIACERLRGGTVSISVTDTGHGIAAENLDKAFIPFERLGAETTSTEGTGIGLALSKQLAEAMGGSISVQSEPGRGSTFTITLRGAAVMRREEPAHPQQTSPGTDEPGPGAPCPLHRR